MIEGYWDGYKGEPEPGDNRSFAFWHGWRNGAVDGKYREIDAAQAALAHDVATRAATSRALASRAGKDDTARHHRPAQGG